MKKVAIICEGRRQVHADDPIGSFATFCAMDGDDSVVDQSMSTVDPKEKIDCPMCRMLWEHARKYKDSDFDKSVKKR